MTVFSRALQNIWMSALESKYSSTWRETRFMKAQAWTSECSHAQMCCYRDERTRPALTQAIEHVRAWGHNLDTDVSAEDHMRTDY